jgi:FlaA1/EpsC-like NDP-sugar epimerase
MGDPVKIVDLAKRMIHLSGLEIRDTSHPEGDIDIEFTGLRPGEKLYEELLIGDNVVGTDHPKIMRANESCLPSEHLTELLAELEAALEERSPSKVRALMMQLVPEFKPVNECMDWMNTTQNHHHL